MQRWLLAGLVGSGAPDARRSLMVTNPLSADHPIVYVSEAWENMCGFTASEAIGHSSRLLQGPGTDVAAMETLANALRQQRPCTALVLNYRSGLESQPFWNMVSISPVFHQGKLLLNMAVLQDYSDHVSRLTVHRPLQPPSQFCRSSAFYQRKCDLAQSPQLNGRPAIIDGEREAWLVAGKSDGSGTGGVQIKRLGWRRLALEPDYLASRVTEALSLIGASFEMVETVASECCQPTSVLFVVHARLDAASFRIIIGEDTCCHDMYTREGSCHVTYARMAGDTFKYHRAFRRLTEQLPDIAIKAVPWVPCM